MKLTTGLTGLILWAVGLCGCLLPFAACYAVAAYLRISDAEIDLRATFLWSCSLTTVYLLLTAAIGLIALANCSSSKGGAA